VSMRLLLMLVLWLTNRPTASSCTMSQEDLSRSRQAQVGFLGNTFWVSSAVVVFCHFRAYVSRCRFPFTALSWIHTSKKNFLYLYTSCSTSSTTSTSVRLRTPAHHPQCPNSLRPLLAIVASYQLFALRRGSDYKDPECELL